MGNPCHQTCRVNWSESFNSRSKELLWSTRLLMVLLSAPFGTTASHLCQGIEPTSCLIPGFDPQPGNRPRVPSQTQMCAGDCQILFVFFKDLVPLGFRSVPYSMSDLGNRRGFKRELPYFRVSTTHFGLLQWPCKNKLCCRKPGTLAQHYSHLRDKFTTYFISVPWDCRTLLIPQGATDWIRQFCIWERKVTQTMAVFLNTSPGRTAHIAQSDKPDLKCHVTSPQHSNLIWCSMFAFCLYPLGVSHTGSIMLAMVRQSTTCDLKDSNISYIPSERQTFMVLGAWSLFW